MIDRIHTFLNWFADFNNKDDPLKEERSFSSMAQIQYVFFAYSANRIKKLEQISNLSSLSKVLFLRFTQILNSKALSSRL